MKYKISRFTHLLETNVGYMLFNSYTKKIGIVYNKNIFNEILSNQYTDNFLLKKLLDDKFFIETDCDEKSISYITLLDNLVSNELFLTILPTLQCNFRCEYCYEDFKNLTLNNDTISNIINFIKSCISNYKNISIDWFGGEPLLEIDSINNISDQLITMCHNYKKPFRASITTNGYLLTKDVFKKMLQNRVYTFQVTLDGLKDTHDKAKHLINGYGTFDVVYNNLLNIKSINSSYFTVIIRTNVTKNIYENLDEYLKMLYMDFGEDKRFTFLFRPVGDWGGNRVENMKNDILCSTFKSVYTKLQTSKYQLNYRIYYNLLVNPICEASKRNSIMIKPDGKIGKCTMYLDDKMNDVGYIDKYGKIHINYNNFTKWVYNFDSIPEECFSCSFFPSCNNSTCPAKKIIVNDNSKCGYENFYINDILYLFSNNIDKYPFIIQYN